MYVSIYIYIYIYVERERERDRHREREGFKVEGLRTNEFRDSLMGRPRDLSGVC